MLLGRRLSGAEEDETFTRIDLKPYEVILFKEVFFYTVRQLKWLATFINKYKYSHMIF